MAKRHGKAILMTESRDAVVRAQLAVFNKLPAAPGASFSCTIAPYRPYPESERRQCFMADALR